MYIVFDKPRFLDFLRIEHDFARRTFDQIDAESMRHPRTIGNWSLKDMMAHLTAWERRVVRWLDAALEGRAPAVPEPGYTMADIDALNKRDLARDRSRSLEDIRTAFERVHGQVVAGLQALPEDDLFGLDRLAGIWREPPWRLVAGNTFNHYIEHIGEVRLWLVDSADPVARLRTQFDRDKIIDLIRSERAFLERTVALVDAAQMTQPGACGDWTVKDVLAHVATWERRFLRWLAVAERGDTLTEPEPGYSWRWDDLDRLNDDSYKEQHDRSLADVQANFHRSHERLMAKVDTLSDDTIFNQTIGRGPVWVYLRANTFDHYTHHAQDIRTWLAGDT